MTKCYQLIAFVVHLMTQSRWHLLNFFIFLKNLIMFNFDRRFFGASEKKDGHIF
jgi:hypothetical protein